MLEVVGEGLGQTGTHSLVQALEIIGLGPCYTILDIEKHPGHHKTLKYRSDGEIIDWRSFFSGYRSAVDWPTVSFLPEIFAMFPECKVVLTLRDASSWYETAWTTIIPGLEATVFHPDPVERSRSELKRRLILDGTFEGRNKDRDFAIAIYENHIASVIDLVPEDQSLLYRVDEGWKKLCDFLGLQIPDKPFPHQNRGAKFIGSAPEWAKHHMQSAQEDTEQDSDIHKECR